MLDQIARQPEAFTAAVDKELSKRSLVNFIECGWHQLEPSRPLILGWHIYAIADHLEAVTRGDINRLLITVPPGTMKSMTVGVFWPAWEWGALNKPETRYLAASYKENLAKRDNVKCRRLIQSRWYQDRWGDRVRLVGDQNEKLKFENEATGWRMAMGFNSLTGERGDRVIIDDPLSVDMAKSDKERHNARDTLLEAVPTRLNDPDNSAIVIVMQRLHEEDPAGIVLEKDLGYVHLMLPMEFETERKCYTLVKPTGYTGEAQKGRYDATAQQWYFKGDVVPEKRREYVKAAHWQDVYPQDKREVDGELLFPERFSSDVVERDKRSLGAVAHAGQNQQRPAPREGGMFKRGNFRYIEAAEVPEDTKWFRGWDLAATDSPEAAQTCGVKIGKSKDGRFFIAHVIRERLGPNDVRKLILNTAISDTRKVKISIPQDPGQAGKAQALDFVQRLAGFRVKTSPETGDKITRAEPFAAQIEAGNVYIVGGPWVDGFLDEVCLFPNGKFKDAVDACSRAFGELTSEKPIFNSQGFI